MGGGIALALELLELLRFELLAAVDAEALEGFARGAGDTGRGRGPRDLGSGVAGAAGAWGVVGMGGEGRGGEGAAGDGAGGDDHGVGGGVARGPDVDEAHCCGWRWCLIFLEGGVVWFGGSGGGRVSRGRGGLAANLLLIGWLEARG